MYHFSGRGEAVLRRLKKLGVELWLITGDNERTAQAILDARALYPDCSLADLYDETVMPPELRTAHQNNDRAVMQAYGFDVKSMTESSCVAALMKLYVRLVEQKG